MSCILGLQTAGARDSGSADPACFFFLRPMLSLVGQGNAASGLVPVDLRRTPQFGIPAREASDVSEQRAARAASSVVQTSGQTRARLGAGLSVTRPAPACSRKSET